MWQEGPAAAGSIRREGSGLKGLPEERAVMLAEYIVEHEATVRRAAQVFHIS